MHVHCAFETKSVASIQETGGTSLSTHLFFFFFQAEDGIRDYKVTGVQTCALPISRTRRGRDLPGRCWRANTSSTPSPFRRPGYCRNRKAAGTAMPSRSTACRKRRRSEKRRVGEEGRFRWSPDH